MNKIIIILILLLTGCSKNEAVNLETLCEQTVYNEVKKAELQFAYKWLSRDNTSYSYGTKVRVISGFYTGLTGTIINKSTSSDYEVDELTIKLDKKLYSGQETLSLYPTDMVVIK
jgi:PBP1b-binding outer membrane lipoprotein LpoB